MLTLDAVVERIPLRGNMRKAAILLLLTIATLTFLFAFNPAFAKAPDVLNHADVHENNRERIFQIEARQNSFKDDIVELKEDVKVVDEKVSDLPALVALAATILGGLQYFFYRRSEHM